MKSPDLNDWRRRIGWRWVLIAMTLLALARAWQMWQHPVIF